MAKKLTKTTNKGKRATTSKAKQKTVNKTKEPNSVSVMVLAIVGIVLLIYFGTTGTVNVDVNVSSGLDETSTTLIQQAIIISEETYASKEVAIQKLRFLPQSMLTDEERNFVESYKD